MGAKDTNPRGPRQVPLLPSVYCPRTRATAADARGSPRTSDRPGEPTVPASKPAVRFIFITLMLDVLGIGLIIPVAPKLVDHLHHGTEAEASYIVSFLQATYAAMLFLFAPMLGSLSDRFGRRPVVLISLFGSGLDYLALSISPTITWLFITRAINGITGANMSAASAYIADVTPPEKRAGAFGMMGAAFGLGFVFGPLIGGTLGEYNIRWPFIAAGILAFLNWLYGMFVLPESLPKDRRRPFSFKRSNPIGALHGLGRYPIVAGLAASLFLLNLAQFGLHATWVLYTSHRYSWGPKDVGLSLAFVGIGAAIVQGGLARKIVPALGEKRSLLIGIALGVFAFLGYGLATHGWMIYCIILFASIGAISQPAVQSLISRAVRPDEQGLVQGTLTSLSSIAGIFGPIIGGSVFGYFISDKAPVYLPGAPFFVGAFLATASWFVAAWALRKWIAPPAPVVPVACPQCGYNVSGIPEPVCPECGTSFAPAQVGSRGGSDPASAPNDAPA